MVVYLTQAKDKARRNLRDVGASQHAVAGEALAPLPLPLGFGSGSDSRSRPAATQHAASPAPLLRKRNVPFGERPTWGFY